MDVKGDPVIFRVKDVTEMTDVKVWVVGGMGGVGQVPEPLA